MKTRAAGITAGRRAGTDRAVLLAHGAGSDLDAPALAAVARELARRSIPSLRFNFAYRDAGRRPPDRAPVLDVAVRAAAGLLARRTGLAPDRLVLGGRSMGGRMCSMAVGAPPTEGPGDPASGGQAPLDALGLMLLGYPLHPAGRPDRLRTEHFGRLSVPCLFVSGTRDALAGRDELPAAARAIPGPVSFCWLDTADHGFRPLVSSGTTTEAVLARVAEASADWVESLP